MTAHGVSRFWRRCGGVALATLLAAQAAAVAQEKPAAAAQSLPNLDRFDAPFGYPTFRGEPFASPAPEYPEYQVPIIYNGPDYDTQRILDLGAVPTLDAAAAAPTRPGAVVCSRFASHC
ncbi:MAG TPA: hypothetical protein VNF99_03215 [Stellaceae bacterium]|nr:hypothetical protein [Stellaceae bacterium]